MPRTFGQSAREVKGKAQAVAGRAGGSCYGGWTPSAGHVMTTTVCYARNQIHEAFIRGFDGQLKARYNSAFLAQVETLGGARLRAEIERELGNPSYQPDEWRSVRETVLILDRAARAGVSLEAMGELVMPTYKESYPLVFEGRTITDAFDILEAAYRRDTSYGGVSPGLVKGPGRASVFRQNSVFPCGYFIGVIKGLLRLFGTEGTVLEMECQWEGSPSCRFDARWGSARAR
jgi:hypothetical protein